MRIVDRRKGKKTTENGKCKEGGKCIGGNIIERNLGRWSEQVRGKEVRSDGANKKARGSWESKAAR